jgi:HEAT repeat protein
MLDQAFEALKEYDWGTDKAPLAPIDQAVAATHGDVAARADLEKRLLAALKSDISRDAKDYVCRKLTIVGTAASVPTLADLLANADQAHMARFALERIEAPEAGQALRDALPKLNGKLKIGAISSIGARRDAQAVTALSGMLKDSDPAVARAAAIALGDISSIEAAKALHSSGTPDEQARSSAIDAQLRCAEALLAENKKADALAIYKSLASGEQPKHVKLAATRGMLACAGKNE